MKRILLSVCIMLLAFAAQATAATVYGVNTANQLIRFKSATPGVLELQVAISGLQPGESVLGIDFRPANGRLYALGSDGRLYTIDTATGAATFVVALTADPTDETFTYAGLLGTEFGFDFNPVADRIRIVSDADQNLRVHPDTGVVTSDNPLAFAAGDPNAGDNPAVTSAAYSSNFPGATTTTLYGIDTFNDIQVIQNPPNQGTLTSNTSSLFLGNLEAPVGFDIGPGSGAAFMAYTNASNPSASLFAPVSLGCCTTSPGAVIGGGSRVRGIAVAASSFFRLSASNYVVDETAGTVTLAIFRFGDVTTSATVSVSTSDGTAISPFDYSSSTNTIFFDPGETVQFASVSIVNNPILEGTETFTVTLNNPSGSEPVTLDTPRSATVTITEGMPTPTPSPTTVTIFGVSQGNQLFSFRSTNPSTIDFSVPITGLQPGENVLNIDVRPATGQLYALGSAARLYTIDTATGAATLVAPLTADPTDETFTFTGLVGTEFGFDFNPVADRIRIVSDAEQNLRVHPDTGVVTSDNPLAYGPNDPNAGRDPSVVAAAYTNPDNDPSTGTTLYDIESAQDLLVTQSPPNEGTLNTVAPLSTTVTSRVGFDIAPDNSAYLLHTPQGGSNNFSRISLTTGSSQCCFNSINFPDVVRDIAVASGAIGVLQFDPATYTVDEGAGSVTVTVTRTGGNSNSPISVNYSTASAFSATPGQDYTTVSGTLTFGPGVTTQSFTVPILEDAVLEGTEQFNVVLSSPTGGAMLGTSTAAVNITDNDPAPGLPTLSVDDVTVAESAFGAVASFTVTLSAPRNGTVTVQYITSNGTAAAGSDYTSVSGSLSFAPGQTTRTIIVPVNDDDAAEGNETFFVTLSNPTNAALADAQGRATITDDDVPTAAFAFSAASFAGNEDAAAILVTVNRTGDTTGAMTVDYATSNGTASDRADYTFAAGTLTFAPGETSQTIPVLISEDSHVEGTETLTVTLSNATGGGGLGGQATATVVIIDDPSEPATNAIDETDNFVIQHYHDFLNREPDAGGLQFWTEGIESCGNDAQCREVKRIDTSAAFFLSIEFQETGYLVERAYRAAFNRRVLIGEFLPDSQEIGRGVVVGQPGFAEVLEANKQAYFEEFVARPQFASVYGALSNAQYVDALNSNTGGALTQSERDALVAALEGGTVTRARALRAVVEDATFAASEFNRAFVLMQYFGYLRRDPDEPGFQFWLNKLNQFNGDFRAAEMVKAFISSIEYRQRFGQ